MTTADGYGLALRVWSGAGEEGGRVVVAEAPESRTAPRSREALAG